MNHRRCSYCHVPSHLGQSCASCGAPESSSEAVPTIWVWHGEPCSKGPGGHLYSRRSGGLVATRDEVLGVLAQDRYRLVAY
jgi:hypothetical protein